MKDHIRTKSTVKLPSLYLNSKLFHRPCRDDRDTTNIGGHNKGLPDPQFESLEPDEDELSVSKGSVSDLEMVNKEKWDDGTTVVHRKSPFPAERKPVVSSKLHDAASVEHVPLSSLRGSQSTVAEHGVQQHLDNPPSASADLPMVYRTPEGTNHIADGHHRLAAAHLRGDKTAKVKVVDLGSSATRKAIRTLEMIKAGAAQESGESWMPQPGKQRKREYDSSFHRDAQPGISGGATPDLPERGRDWHGTVPGVPDEPGAQGSKIEDELDHPPANLVDDKSDAKTVLEEKNAEAKKALAAAPRFSPGPFIAPPERDFLRTKGWSDEDIERGDRPMPPRLRAEFNRWLTSTVRKSIERLVR